VCPEGVTFMVAAGSVPAGFSGGGPACHDLFR
jgi:hypothetical protein